MLWKAFNKKKTEITWQKMAYITECWGEKDKIMKLRKAYCDLRSGERYRWISSEIF